MKLLNTYDNFFRADKTQEIYNYVLQSFYQIGWEDGTEPEHKQYPNLYSKYSIKDLEQIDILNPILKKLDLNKKDYSTCIVNLTKPLDVNFIHTHPKQKVVLYYANLTWNPEWGGETIFYKQDRKSIELTNTFTPNRLIFFDGSVPHTIKAQNFLGPSYRFTISFFFNYFE